MKHIIQQIYDGEIYPDEQIVPDDPQYKPTHINIDEEMAFLKGMLSVEGIFHLEELEKLFMASASMTSYAAFNYGFKLGIQLMHEALEEDNEKNSPIY